MNYEKLYNLIISKARNNDRCKLNGCYERHHIVPKSLGGSNSQENLVLLTPKEHFVAHLLLWKITKDKRMAHAFRLLSNKGLIKSSRMYQEVSIKSREFLVESSKKKGYIGGRIGGNVSKDKGLGLHRLTSEQHAQNGRKSGKEGYVNKIGAHALPKERMQQIRSNNGKISALNKTGIHSVNPERRKELNLATGNKTYHEKTGIHKLSIEERINNGKIGAVVSRNKTIQRKLNEYNEELVKLGYVSDYEPTYTEAVNHKLKYYYDKGVRKLTGLKKKTFQDKRQP